MLVRNTAFPHGERGQVPISSTVARQGMIVLGNGTRVVGCETKGVPPPSPACATIMRQPTMDIGHHIAQVSIGIHVSKQKKVETNPSALTFADEEKSAS